MTTRALDSRAVSAPAGVDARGPDHAPPDTADRLRISNRPGQNLRTRAPKKKPNNEQRLDSGIRKNRTLSAGRNL